MFKYVPLTLAAKLASFLVSLASPCASSVPVPVPVAVPSVSAATMAVMPAPLFPFFFFPWLLATTYVPSAVRLISPVSTNHSTASLAAFALAAFLFGKGRVRAPKAASGRLGMMHSQA